MRLWLNGIKAPSFSLTRRVFPGALWSHRPFRTCRGKPVSGQLGAGGKRGGDPSQSLCRHAAQCTYTHLACAPPTRNLSAFPASSMSPTTCVFLQAAVVTSAPVVLAAARRHIDDLRAESLAYALTVLVDRLRDLVEDQVGYISGLYNATEEQQADSAIRGHTYATRCVQNGVHVACPCLPWGVAGVSPCCRCSRADRHDEREHPQDAVLALICFTLHP